MKTKNNSSVRFVGYFNGVSYRTDNFRCMVTSWADGDGYDIVLKSRRTGHEERISLDKEELDLILRATKKLGR